MERTFEGIDIRLNAAISHIASQLFPSGFDANDEAPTTLAELNKAFNSRCYVVWRGASDATIFGDREVNWAFRAWHDFTHWRNNLPFTPDGEREAYKRQCDDLVTLYGDSDLTRHWRRILDTEINGQLRYAAEHAGAFPTNQKAFTLAYLENPEAAIRATY
jgi:hypothetical protein